MEETYRYRIERKFDCDTCGHPNLHIAYLSSDLKTESEISFLIGTEAPPTCTRCREPHLGELGIGVERTAERF
jgi:hypothetical protein